MPEDAELDGRYHSVVMERVGTRVYDRSDLVFPELGKRYVRRRGGVASGRRERVQHVGERRDSACLNEADVERQGADDLVLLEVADGR